MKWDVSSIPAGSTVTEVAITLQVHNKTNHLYQLWEMLAPWTESSATWNNTQPDSNTGANVSSFTPTSTGSYTINLNADGIALVQSWIDGATNNRLTLHNQWRGVAVANQ